jgi:D-alanine-D-alanine ligase
LAIANALQRLSIDSCPIDAGDDLIEQLQRHQLDRVFIALHGPGGEDGTLQGALEYLRLPYTGSGVLASALAMDKLRCKRLWRGLGLPTADFVALDAHSDWSDVLASLGGSVMVKPSREGSSIGMSRVDSVDQLEHAWRRAADLDSEVIAERRLVGAEYTVAIVAGSVLPAIRITTGGAFYDYQAKYNSTETEYFCPSGLSSAREQRLGELCLAAFGSLDCRGWGRVDVMADERGEFQLLEVNTVPGMTDQSLVPKAAAAAGVSFDQLIVNILQASLS